MEWFRKNSLVANQAKFQTMLVKSNNIDDIELNVTAENVSLPSSETMKVLGIDIDNRLTFDGHVSSMCIKAGKQLNVLQRLKGSLDLDSRMAIYKSFIMSNFNYCPVIWMFTSKTSLSKLENIQRRALRFVLDDYQTGYPDLLQNTNVPGIKIMVLRYLAIEVFKCVNEINPAYLNDMLTRKQCPYALRDSSILVRPKVNLTQYGLKSFKAMARKFEIFYLDHLRPTYLQTNLDQWSNNGIARKVNVPFVTSTRNQVFTFTSIHMYVFCSCMCIYGFIYACIYTYMTYIEIYCVFTNHEYFSCYKHDVLLCYHWVGE